MVCGCGVLEAARIASSLCSAPMTMTYAVIASEAKQSRRGRLDTSVGLVPLGPRFCDLEGQPGPTRVLDLQKAIRG